MPPPPFIHQSPDGAVLIRVKAVPGARRDEIAGPLGDRLKIRVSAPPEGGKANDAICALLASALGLRRRQATVIHGPTSPEKTIRIEGADVHQVTTAAAAWL